MPLPTSWLRDTKNLLPPVRWTRSTPIRAQRTHLIALVPREMGTLTLDKALAAKAWQ